MTKFLISCMTGPGGIFEVTDASVVSVDNVPTSGMDLSEHHLYRARFSRKDLVVDRLNLKSSRVTATWSVPGGAHPHDVCLHEDLLAVVDTLHDRVVWLDPSNGKIVKEWQATTLGDAWHINSLVVHEGALLASIFGKFSTDRGWWGAGHARLGEVIEVGTGEPVLTGLSAPHAPTRWQDKWLVLNTFDSTLCAYGQENEWVLPPLVVGGWPNGLRLDPVDPSIIWVGISDGDRHPQTPAPHGNSPGRIKKVSLDQWKILEERIMPCTSVYNLIPYRQGDDDD